MECDIFFIERFFYLKAIGKETYTPDNRFQSVHNAHTDEWALKVISVQELDSNKGMIKACLVENFDEFIMFFPSFSSDH